MSISSSATKPSATRVSDAALSTARRSMVAPPSETRVSRTFSPASMDSAFSATVVWRSLTSSSFIVVFNAQSPQPCRGNGYARCCAAGISSTIAHLRRSPPSVAATGDVMLTCGPSARCHRALQMLEEKLAEPRLEPGRLTMPAAIEDVKVDTRVGGQCRSQELGVVEADLLVFAAGDEEHGNHQPGG